MHLRRKGYTRTWIAIVSVGVRSRYRQLGVKVRAFQIDCISSSGQRDVVLRLRPIDRQRTLVPSLDEAGLGRREDFLYINPKCSPDLAFLLRQLGKLITYSSQIWIGTPMGQK